jgi:hypothetical protein
MTRKFVEFEKRNKVKVKKINAGYYLATVVNNGREKKVNIEFWCGPNMNQWRWSIHDLFSTKKEAILALEEIEFDLIEEIKEV